MSRIDKWANLPDAVRQHLIDRMRDRAIGIPDLNRPRPVVTRAVMLRRQRSRHPRAFEH
jgi:hypothetical protein